MVLLVTCVVLALAAMPSPAQDVETHGVYNPVADPKAIVTAGHARFTILTTQMIRMEWAADGKFEDHASLVFLNRKLPVPKFGDDRDKRGTLNIHTDALDLSYTGDGKFTP